VSWNGPLLIPAATRLQGIFFWDLIIYLLEGLVFLFTGLQARILFEHVERFSLYELAVSTLIVTAIIVAARFIWVFPAVYLPRWLSPSLRKRDPEPPWQQTFVLAFTGVRGVVSLAAALALPLTLENGAPFPYRDHILFITFGVIIITLVGFGLMLPSVIRWLGVAHLRRHEERKEREAEMLARQGALEAALRRLEEMEQEGKIPKQVLELLRARHDHRRRLFPDQELRELADEVRLELVRIEREYIYQLLREGRITDEARRRLERELDLEETDIISHYKQELLPLPLTP
jgi:CPA1 family monovalent cation:H+ antiporter